MNGKEAYDEIRKMRPAIRVIFTSGYNSALVQKKGVREENLDIVMKPISPRDLLNKVREVLDT
jgi:polar amino acid transport system substrate-binding protein